MCDSGFVVFLSVLTLGRSCATCLITLIDQTNTDLNKSSYAEQLNVNAYKCLYVCKSAQCLESNWVAR